VGSDPLVEKHCSRPSCNLLHRDLGVLLETLTFLVRKNFLGVHKNNNYIIFIIFNIFIAGMILVICFLFFGEDHLNYIIIKNQIHPTKTAMN
jgi:hypothetical protein